VRRRESRTRTPTRSSGSRSIRRERSPSPSRMSRRMKDLTQTVRKLERKQKDIYAFKNKGIEKQAVFVQEVGEWLEDTLRTKLETVVGLFPAGLKDVIKAGEKLLEDRLHLLKIADLYGWPAVAEFTATVLARNEVEEKKLKKIVKQNELKNEKVREKKQYTGKYNRYTSGTGGSSGTYGGSRYGCLRDTAEVIENISAGSQVTPRMARLERTGSVLTAAREAISSSTAEQLPKMGEQAVVGRGDEDEEEEGFEGVVGDNFIENKRISQSWQAR
jgi:hypothetical protein